MKLRLVSLVFAVAACVACNADGRRTPGSESGAAVGTTGETERIRAGDRNFIHDVLLDGTAEVQLGRLAGEHAASADVQQFAEMMVKDHIQAGNQLRQIATEYSLAGDPVLDEKHRDLISRLSDLRGAEFDRAYMKAMVDDHQDAVDTLQTRVDEKNRTAVRTGQEPKDVNVKPEPADNALETRINQWAADALPVVKGHLDRANAIHEKLGRARNATANR
jgi:putative membrane protein